MKNEFTAVVERDGDWYFAYCPKYLAPTGKVERLRRRGPALPRRLH
jgi:hypothetical protein